MSSMFCRAGAAFGSLCLLGLPVVLEAAGPAGACPAPWWVWAVFGGLLLPWIPILLVGRKVYVTFDDGIDDRPYLQQYKRGQKVKRPDAFSKPGFCIEGWYRSKKFESAKKWDFGDKISRSMVLHAKWVPQPDPAAASYSPGPPRPDENGGAGA